MRKKNIISIALSVVFSVVFVAAAVNAATTIGTDIDTGGTLTANGLTTLGNASTTLLSVSGNSYLGTVSSGVWNGTAIGDAYITKTGAWTGTFDGQEGSYYLNAGNLTNFGTPFYTFFNATTTDALTEGSTNKYLTQNNWAGYMAATTTDALTEGSTNKYLTENNWAGYMAATTTDALAEGSTNKYLTQNNWAGYMAATTTLPNITTLANLTGYVPYTGATADVNLGAHRILIDEIFMNDGLGGGMGISLDATRGIFFSGDIASLNFSRDNNRVAFSSLGIATSTMDAALSIYPDSDSGTYNFLIRNRADDANLLTLADSGSLYVSGNVGIGTSTPATQLEVHATTGTSTVSVISEAASTGSRIILEDSDGAGCTEIYALNGTLISATVACPAN